MTANPPRLVAVGGGKGGVGKSLIVSNLAVVLADLGHRVVVVDTDLPGANLHTCLGVPAPRASLAAFVTGQEQDLAKLVVDTPYENLQMIGATGGHPGFGRLRPSRREELAEALRLLSCDFVLLDVAAGTHPEVIDFFLVGDQGLLVFAPEPTSVENAYSFLRSVLLRRMYNALLNDEARKRVDQAMEPGNEQGIRTPFDLLREIEAIDPEQARRVVSALRGFRPCLLVNQVRTTEDIKLGFQVASVCQKYFGIDAEYLGYLNHDEAVRRSVVERRPVVRAFPESDAAVYLRRIGRKLLGRLQSRAPEVRS